MKTTAFYGAIREALGRARQDDLSLADLTLMVTCGRAWETAGRPDSGTLANAWDAAWLVFEADRTRIAMERELALWIVEDGERRGVEWARQQTATRTAMPERSTSAFAHVRPTVNALRWAA